MQYICVCTKLFRMHRCTYYFAYRLSHVNFPLIDFDMSISHLFREIIFRFLYTAALLLKLLTFWTCKYVLSFHIVCHFAAFQVHFAWNKIACTFNVLYTVVVMKNIIDVHLCNVVLCFVISHCVPFYLHFKYVSLRIKLPVHLTYCGYIVFVMKIIIHVHVCMH